MNISVVAPTYKRRALLPFCIDSVLPQLESGDELLILIDGEQDPSYAYVAELAAKDPRVRITMPGGKVGPFEIYRMLFERAAHDHIVMVHDDEIYHSRLLEKVRARFTREPAVTFQLAGQIRVLISDSVHSFANIAYPEEKLMEGREWVSGQIGSGMLFNCSCLVFRRTAEALKVLTREQLSADNLFAIVQASSGKVTQSDYFSSTWLLHATNTSRRDYLTINHHPLWRGIEALQGRPGYEYLTEEDVRKQRQIAARAYLWNAFAAAAVDGKREAFLQCVRYAAEAVPGKLLPSLLRVFTVKPLWFVFCRAAKASKVLSKAGKSRRPEKGFDARALAVLLEQPETFVTEYLATATAR